MPDAEDPRRLEYVRLSDLRGADLNVKRHDHAGLRRSIAEFGYTEPGLIDERTGRLVAGHGRLADLLERRGVNGDPPAGIRVDGDGEWLVPVVRGWASESDAHARAYLAASNKLSENGGWDTDTLPDYLAGLAEQGTHLLELSGFTPDELAAMLDDGAGVDSADELADTEDKYTEQYGVIVICGDEAEQERVYDELKAEGRNCRVVTT